MDERFPRYIINRVNCYQYKLPQIDLSRLSCLLPGAIASQSTSSGGKGVGKSKGLEIREPKNWMGVTISDLGRGYAWSDYIQMVGVREVGGYG